MPKNVKLVAIGTVRRGELKEPAAMSVDPRTGAIKHVPAVTERKTYAPGEEFSVPEAEAEGLIASGAAQLPVAVVVETEVVPVAENTAPRGPYSGETEAPEPDAVATETKPSDPNPDDAPVLSRPVNEVRRTRAR